MVQTGQSHKITGRQFEDYASLHKYCHSISTTEVNEWENQVTQTSAGTAAEVFTVGTTAGTVGDIGKTAIALKVKTSGAVSGQLHAQISAHYITNAGVHKTAIIADAIADMTTATDFDTPVTDFYCWDKENYTPANCFTSSLALAAGVSMTADVGGTTKATIATGATTTLDSTLIGVGQIYSYTETDVADQGFIETLYYTTPWGALKGPVTSTIPAAGTTPTKFLDANGYSVGDFYRSRVFKCNNLAIDEMSIGNVTAGNAVYDEIIIANAESTHTRFMALGAAYGKSFLGEVRATFGSIAGPLTVQVSYTPYGETLERTISWSTMVDNARTQIAPIQLAPCTEVTTKIIDDNVHHGSAQVTCRFIEV